MKDINQMAQAMQAQPIKSAQLSQTQATPTQTINGADPLLWLWETGAELYGSRWIKDWGACPSDKLRSILSKLSAEEIKRGLAECMRLNSEWPPVPVSFVNICKTAGIDIDGAFNRMIKKEPPANIAEKVTRGEIGYNCRSLPDDKARALWAKQYRVNFQKMRDGKLAVEETKLLPEHVAAKETDTMRDNFKPTTAASARIMQRVNEIRRSK